MSTIDLFSTVSASELISEGVGFTIQSADADFAEDGELLGYSEVVDHTYAAGDGRYVIDEHNRPEISERVADGHYAQRDLGALCDTADLSDDRLAEVEPARWEVDDRFGGCPEYIPPSWMPGRWAHVREAHFEEQRRSELLSQPGRGDLDLNYGAMHYGKEVREKRVRRLMRWLRAEAFAVRLARRKGRMAEVRSRRAKLVDAKSKWCRLYKASVDHCRETERWWELYLRKDQRDLLFRAADKASRV